MKCKKCPFSMVCMSGSCIPGTYGLCIHCGRFFINMKKKPLVTIVGSVKPAPTYTTFLFKCELRPVLHELVKFWDRSQNKSDVLDTMLGEDRTGVVEMSGREQKDGETDEEYAQYNAEWRWDKYVATTINVEDAAPQRGQKSLVVSVCCDCEFMHGSNLRRKPVTLSTLKYIMDNWVDLDATPEKGPKAFGLVSVE